MLPLSPKKKAMGEVKLKKITKPSSHLRHLWHLRREGKLPKTNFRRLILVQMKNLDPLRKYVPRGKGDIPRISKTKRRRVCVDIS